MTSWPAPSRWDGSRWRRAPTSSRWTPRPGPSSSTPGHGEGFGHGLGHGVGLRIHEAPALSPLGAGILVERVPVTVEPGVYLPGRGGVRIEDTLVVRAGGAETLTTAPRELLVLG